MLRAIRSARGFTLLELTVALAVLGVLLAAAVPGFTAYSANNSLRSAAQAFYSAAQKARAEAVQRNEIVDVVLTNAAPAAAVAALAGDANGANWVMRVRRDPINQSLLIDSRLGTEAGGANIRVNTGGPTLIGFNGRGETDGNVTVVVQFRHATQNPGCLLAESVRCLNVRISGGGQARLCEPGQPANDNRSC